MSCLKSGLLRSRSRSQRRFKMSMNVCRDDVFWVTEHFVTKFSMVVQHHEPECHAEFLLLLWLSSRSRSQRGFIWSKYDSFQFIFWTVDSLATKLGLMIHHHKPECPVKKIGLLRSRSRSQQRNKMLMFVQIVTCKPPSIIFPNLVLWCIIMQELIWSKYDNVYCIFWTADPLQ